MPEYHHVLSGGEVVVPYIKNIPFFEVSGDLEPTLCSIFDQKVRLKEIVDTSEPKPKNGPKVIKIDSPTPQRHVRSKRSFERNSWHF